MRIKISNKWIGEDKPVFIVAEAGINHNGRVKIAKQLIEKAREVGADAVKFQTFKARDLVSPQSNYFTLFKKVELEPSVFGELSDFAKSNGILFFSTPFSEESVDILSKIKIPMFKISSGDLTHLPLIKYVASKKKPVIISTGMANLEEIRDAVKAISSCGNQKIIIMHSISSYPTPPSEVNLKAISTLKKIFAFPIGYSDNGSGLEIPLMAITVGAKILEKHFTLNKNMKGPDHSFSADPKEFKELVKRAREIDELLGNGKKCPQPSEMKNLINARRSIFSNTTIYKGTKITKEMIKIRRPATGIAPAFLQKVLGRRVNKIIHNNEPLKWSNLINKKKTNKRC